jgi:hypothetical protein
VNREGLEIARDFLDQVDVSLAQLRVTDVCDEPD